MMKILSVSWSNKGSIRVCVGGVSVRGVLKRDGVGHSISAMVPKVPGS